MCHALYGSCPFLFLFLVVKLRAAGNYVMRFPHSLRSKMKRPIGVGRWYCKALPLDTLVDETHTVRDVLHEKHPDGMPLSPQVVTDSIPQPVHPIIFEEITASAILESSLHTDGSAGPSGLDAQAWRRICSSFQKASTDLCEAIAKTARKIGGTYVDPEPLKTLTACRLVALDKCPGVRPIGIGEVAQ